MTWQVALPPLVGWYVVVVPSEYYALLATDFYPVLETSDLPGGVVNIVTGDQDVLSEVLAKHYDIEGLWYWGTRNGSRINPASLATASQNRRLCCVMLTIAIQPSFFTTPL